MDGNELLERALDGDDVSADCEEYLESCGCGDLTDELARRCGMRVGSRVRVGSSLVDWVLSRFRGKSLLGAVAFMVSVGAVESHEIVHGETLFGLSGGNVPEVIALNPGLTADTVLRPGMRIVLPGEAVSVYNVVKGDTFIGIARKLGVSVKDLKKANPQIGDYNRLSIGMAVNVPGGVKKSDGAVRSAPGVKKSDGAVRSAPGVKKSDGAVKDASKIDFVARVLYSETSTQCSDDEVKWVCQVIANRIGKKDFGGAGDAYGVVRVPKAFSAVNKHNAPWNDYSRGLNSATERDYDYAMRLMSGDTSFLPGDRDVVYYHDKRLKSAPDDWTNRYWRPVEMFRTDHFVFYKIVPNRKAVTRKKK